MVIAAWTVIEQRPAQYYAAFLIMEGLMIGVFSALDGLLFYFFWEAMLIPMFLIIGVWGGPRRVYATLKFFLYTFLGSVFMLVALIYMLMKSGDFSIAAFHALPLSATEQMWIFFAFFAAFAVKIPMVPVHTWLPDAHVEAPTGGSVVLAAIMLKMGGYGFLRFALPITPDASSEFDWLLIALSLIAVVYIGFVALVQTDMKKLIAYSSIAHMGFVTLGSFLVYDIIAGTGAVQGAGMGIDGAMVQMVSHGLISGALFLCVGVMYDRVHSREISAYGGVINTMPKFAAFMVFFALANAGLPGTSGFVGEFLVIPAWPPPTREKLAAMASDENKLEPPIKAVIDATNAGDHNAFVAAFTKDGAVNDWGRVLVGRAEIAKWDKEENTGVQSQFRVKGVSRLSGEILVLVDITGNGYNGSSTFSFRLQGNKVASILEIG